MTAVLNELAPPFERASGHKLVIHFDSTPNLIKLAGDPFDLGVVPIDVFKDATAKARFVLPTVDIARVGYGVAVRAGAPKPDVSTPDALKKTLLGAQSIAYLPTSAAGAYVTGVFERLGIAEAMKVKTKPQSTTGEIAEAVAKGDAELGVFLVNVLMVPGVEIAGSFPADLQQETGFHCGYRRRYQASRGRQSLHRLSDQPGSHRRDQEHGFESRLANPTPILDSQCPLPASRRTPSTDRPDTAP